MIDFLSSGAAIASDLVARTASTVRVQGIVQLSLAPAFLLAAIGALLNVMNGRLIWIADRVDRLESEDDPRLTDRYAQELPLLRKRRRYAHSAINLSTAAALMICLVVGLMFISAFIRPALGTFVAAAWLLAMALVFSSLLLFLFETHVAASSLRRQRRFPRISMNRKRGG